MAEPKPVTYFSTKPPYLAATLGLRTGDTWSESTDIGVNVYVYNGTTWDLVSTEVF